MTFQAQSLPTSELHGVTLFSIEMNGNNAKAIRNLRNIAKDVTSKRGVVLTLSFSCSSQYETNLCIGRRILRIFYSHKAKLSYSHKHSYPSQAKGGKPSVLFTEIAALQIFTENEGKFESSWQKNWKRYEYLHVSLLSCSEKRLCKNS